MISGPSGGKSKPSRTNSLSDESETRFHVLALCAGIGGIELGLKLAMPESRAVCYVEGEAYAASVLVRAMEQGHLDQAPIWSDVRSFNGKPWRGVVDCVVGGYPCQPFSTQGNRKGADDPRHLWPHFKRIIGECRPSLCFFENVSGHVSLGLNEVLDDLCGMGFHVASGLFTAEEVGATHKRERVFIMAHDAQLAMLNTNMQGGTIRHGTARPNPFESARRSRGDVANANGRGWRIRRRPKSSEHDNRMPLFPPGPEDLQMWAEVLGVSPVLEPSVCRMADGLPDRSNRLRCLGNAVVPLVAGYAFSTLRDAFN